MSRQLMKNPINVSQLTSEQRKRLAKNQQAYFKTYGKPAPSRLVQGSMMQLTRGRQFDNVVRRATPQEVNYVDLAAAGYECSTTGSITLLATIAQGASVNQRIGKRAYYKSILMRGRMAAGNTTQQADAAVLIIYDKRPTGALPAITDILTSISSFAFMNDNNTGRFEVIRRYDKVFAGNALTPTTGLELYNADDFISLKKRPIVFESAGTGAIGDIDEGAIYLVTVGSNVTGTSAPILTASFRTRYTEQ